MHRLWGLFAGDVDMRKIFSSGVVVASLMLFSGCTDPGDTTAIGATAGGVLGAGLGAIVGNQTGDTATGLVIGGLAGAGAGAAVGNALEAQQVAVRQQDEAIERQQNTIQAQNAELKELRRGASDSGRTSGASANGTGGKARYSWSSSREEALSRSRREARAHSSKSGSSQFESPPRSVRATSGRSYTTSGAAFSGSGTSGTAARTANSKIAESGTLDAGVERRLLRAESVTKESVVASNSSAGALKERTIGMMDPQAEAEASTGASGGAAALAGDSSQRTAPASVECQQAVEEEANAERATEASQQLFHLRRALRLCPEDPRFHVALGKSYASMKRSEDAAFEFKEALRIDSSYAPALQSLQALSKEMQSGEQH